MNHMGLADSNFISGVRFPVNADATVTNSAAIDMAGDPANGIPGFSGVCFVISTGVAGANGTIDALVQRDDNSGFNSPTNINGAALVQGTTANAVYILDVWRPSERYVRLQTKGQTNSVQFSAIAIRYRPQGTLPPIQGAAQYVKVAEN